MLRWHGVRPRVFHFAVLSALLAAGPAPAHQYEDARRSLDLSLDPLARSPRLLGMGRLTLVVDDPNNRITLWDFAGNTAGILGSDSASVVEFRPSTAATSSVRDIDPGAARIRQDLAARELRLGGEAWRRTPGVTAYGLVGSFGLLRLDRPFDTAVEQRTRLTQPDGMVVVNGAMPYVLSDRMRYALHLRYAYESTTDRFRAVVSNAAGEFIDRDGEAGSPPDIFTPDERTTRTLGGGAAFSYRLGEPLTAAIRLDHSGSIIKANNAGTRYISERRESRPVAAGQVSLVGRLGSDLEWGADARGWKSKSDQTWVFSLSTGTASIPLGGRGRLLDREEEGSSLRTRARYTLGAFEIGAGAGTRYREVAIVAPPASDATSFNHFRNVVFHFSGTDTLALPDSVSSSVVDERGWEAGAGAAWRLPGRRGIVGVEVHRDRDLTVRDDRIQGPRRVGWEVRTGVEYGVTPTLTVRGGYVRRQEDRDEFTRQNEFVSHAVTAGGGLHPAGAVWGFETAYALEWSQADYGDPGRPRGSRQRLAAQARWRF